MRKIILGLLFTGVISFASNTPIATGFDYPIGNKGYDNNGNKVPLNERISSAGMGSDYNSERNEEYNLGKNVYANNVRGGSSGGNNWYVIQDTGSYYKASIAGGLHPGEDWNYASGNSDAGKAVYAIADGKVIYLETTYSNTTRYGWTMVIEHKLPDNSNVYSIYTHITYDKNNDAGNVATKKSSFSYTKDDIVHKGNIIGRIRKSVHSNGRVIHPAHLHFEIRNSNYNKNNLYPNDNGNGYYSDDKRIERNGMTKKEVLKAFKLMKKDGILDPSDFIDDHRSLNQNTNSSTSIIDGAGSLIRPEILGTEKEANCTWGCYRDEADMQVHTIPSTVSFQWNISTNCQKLKVGVLASEDYRKAHPGVWIHPYKALKVKIYTKAWDSPVVSEAFEATLPKTVDYVDGWNNIIVTSQKPLTEVQKIIAVCTENDDGKDMSMLDKTLIDLPLEYKFGGQSSIIRGSNANYNDQQDGIYQDVAIGLSDNKSMSLFQWQTSRNCKSLVIKSGHYPNGNGLDTTVNGVSIKGWSDKDWVDNKCNKKLPCTINAPSSNGGKYENYYIIKVKTNASTLDGNRVSAVCKQ